MRLFLFLLKPFPKQLDLKYGGWRGMKAKKTHTALAPGDG